MHASINDGYLYIMLEHAEARYAAKLAEVPSAEVSKTGATFRFTPTATNLAAVRAVLNGWIDVGMTAAERRLLQSQSVWADLPADESAIPGARQDPPPWDHQVRGFWFAVRNEAPALAMGMGTGKTRTLAEVVRYLELKNILIVCLKSKIMDWVHELERWGCPPATPLVDSSLKRLAAAKAADPRILVTNFDGVWREPLAGWLQQQRWDLVAIDESQHIKAPSGVCSKFMATLTRRTARRANLSGGMMAHSPLDVFGQYRFLDPGVFGTVYERFRLRYAVTANDDGTGKVLGFQNEHELSEKFHSLAFEAPRSLLTLPPVSDVVLDVQLSAEEADVYARMERDMVVEFDQGLIAAVNLGVRMMKLKQATSGFMIDSQTGQPIDFGTSKLDRLSDWLEEIAGEPAVVFARFTHQIEQILRRCGEAGVAALEMSGRRNDLPQWQAGAGQVLVAQHRTGSEGVDMTRACLAFYYDIEMSLNTYNQSRLRLDRPGQKNAVTYYHAVVANSADSDLYAALKDRGNIIDYIMSLARRRVEAKARKAVAV